MRRRINDHSPLAKIDTAAALRTHDESTVTWLVIRFCLHIELSLLHGQQYQSSL